MTDEPTTGSVRSLQDQTSSRKPNVLFIMTDQHRADLMTCAGRDLVPTPSIDRIAERGVRFSRAYCPYPVCLASRSSLLTGLFAHETGAVNNTDRLDWRYRTIAHHFAESGYLTGLIGKMHFNDAHKHGFEYYLSINDWLMYLGPKVQHYANEIANHPLAPVFFETMIDDGAGFPDVSALWDGQSPWVGNVERFPYQDMASKLDAEDHLDAFISREAIKFMARHQDQPFFLVASFMKPHTPLYAPKEWADRYPIEAMELPEVGDISQYPAHVQQRIRGIQKHSAHQRKAHRAGYMANLAFVDTCIGAVYDALGQLGLADNTIVVYTSDHGEMDGDHGLFQKFILFEPSVRIPLIVSYPKCLPQGVVTDALTEYIGLYPTLAELAGLPAPNTTTIVDMPGAPGCISATSFADVLRDPTLEGPEAVFSEYALRSETPQYMIRTDSHKLVWNDGSTHELYDMVDDPGELRNLIDDPSLRAERERLREMLFARFDPAMNPYRQGSASERADVFGPPS